MKKILLYLLILPLSSFSQIQKESTKFIKLGVGVGALMQNPAIIYSIGWEKENALHPRLRFNPNFTIAASSTRGITDIADIMVRSSSFEYRIQYDVFKKNSHSLMLYGSPFINVTRGLDAGGGDPEACGNCSGDGFFDKLFGGVMGGIAWRIYNPDKKYSIEIKPFNYNYGWEINRHNPNNSNFEMVYFQINVNYKLK